MAVLDPKESERFWTAFQGLNLAAAVPTGRYRRVGARARTDLLMAEPFELVRTTRQHIRRGAAFLEQGRFDDALREVGSALALDPDNASAQALRDRINSARLMATHGPSHAAVPDLSLIHI